MKRLAFAIALLPGLALAEVATWNIDPAHTQSTFSVRHLVISNVRGEFKKTTGVVKLDEKDPTKSSIEANIDATTIHTREDRRDADLRSANFFDVEKYPRITFRSTKVERSSGKDTYKVTGDLTMHGVTRPVVLDATLTPEVKDFAGKLRRGVQATTKLNRREFGLEYSKAIEAGPIVGDEVSIEIDAELVKETAGDAAAAGPGKADAPRAKK